MFGDKRECSDIKNNLLNFKKVNVITFFFYVRCIIIVKYIICYIKLDMVRGGVIHVSLDSSYYNYGISGGMCCRYHNF